MKNIKEQLESTFNFVKRYFLLLIITAVGFVLTAIVPSWNFIPYGAAKALLALVTALLIRNLFLTTVDKYIESGAFRTDFFASSKEVKVCVAAGVACVFFLGACICFS